MESGEAWLASRKSQSSPLGLLTTNLSRCGVPVAKRSQLIAKGLPRRRAPQHRACGSAAGASAPWGRCEPSRRGRAGRLARCAAHPAVGHAATPEQPQAAFDVRGEPSWGSRPLLNFRGLRPIRGIEGSAFGGTVLEEGRMPQKRVLEITCPRGRRTNRTTTTSGPVTVRCTCGCRYYVQFR
jgi:hypothetical protein